MTETNETNQANEIIQNNEGQKAPIELDLINNQLTINPKLLQKIIEESQEVTTRAAKLAKTDINDIDEDEMTQLNKDIKPITAYEKKFNEFGKTLNKELRERDQRIKDAYADTVLKPANFDQVQDLTKQLRQLQKDFKANRGNKRWESIHEKFDAQMETYPELPKYANTTLGNFNYFRVHHPDLVSEAKTKNITNATIKELNDELFRYHQDMQHLLESTLNPVYYARIIEQYAAEPSTNKMLDLIQTAMVQQVKDQNAKVIQNIELNAKTQLNQLWFNNDKINQYFSQFKPQTQSEDEYTLYKLKLMKSESQAILNSLQLESFIKDENQVDEVKLESTLKSLIQNSFTRVGEQLESHQKQFSADRKPAEPAKPKQTLPYQWLLDYLQVKQWQKISNNDDIKTVVLMDLFENITNKQSIWRQQIHSNQELIKTIHYITEL